MTTDIEQSRENGRAPGPARMRRIDVALGRRVMVLGDLLLPPTPSPSSLATCRDIAQKLAEWEGPGIVVICGQLVIGGCPGQTGPAESLRAHRELTAAFSAFAARPDSQVVVVVAEPAQENDEVARELEGLGVSLAPGADLHCVTGAGGRTVLIRTGTLRPDTNPPSDATPGEDRPWLAGMERLDDPRLARRFVTSRLLYRRLRRYVWAPPLVLAALALLLRLEFVVDGLGHVFHSPRQQRALQNAYDASWFSRVLITIIIGVALLAVLAVVVAVTSRGIWRALGRREPAVPVVLGRGTGRGRPVDGALAAHPRRRGRPRRHPKGHQ